MAELVRTALAPILAVAAVLLFDLRTRRLGLDPPGFASLPRRILGLVGLTFVFWIGVFLPLSQLGVATEPEFSAIPVWQLFVVHALLVAAIAGWWAAGFLGTAPHPGAAGAARALGQQLGLGGNALREIGVGLLFGVGAWFAVICGLVGVALVASGLGGEDLLPKSPPAAIPWLAAQPVVLRLALAFSAGTVEELFFRGLLQPRAGIVFSTALFALAHLSYGQPFLLVGVTALSVLYALLVRWRQSLWAAMTAHFLFDAIQMLVVIPSVLRLYPAAE